MSGEKTELEPALARFIEQFGKVDDTVTAVLKGHLLIEEALDGIISNFVFHPEPLANARLGFAQKLQLARAMSLREHDNSMWNIAGALNSLRNELTHHLESPRRGRKVKALLDAYRHETSGHPAEKHAEQPEPEAVQMCCALFLGYLTTFREEVDRFKELIGALDSTMNRPPAKAAVKSAGAGE